MTQPVQPYSLYFTVGHGQTDRNAFMRPEIFFEYMQEAAACNASILGFGYEQLAPRNLMWVISRVKMHIRRTPKMSEKIEIRTRPSGILKLFALREYCFLNAETQEILAEASSWWLILDSVRLRPLRPLDVFPEGLPESEVYFTDLPKIPHDPALTECSVRQVYESMLDCNCHLNNAKAVGIIYDRVSELAGPAPRFTDFQINFTAATPPGGELHVSASLNGKAFHAEACGGLPGEKAVPRFEAVGTLE